MQRSAISLRNKQLLYVTLIVLVFVVWLAFLVAQRPNDGLGTDFYPIYYAGQLVRAGEDPYGPAAIAHLVEVWHVPFAAAGFAYPLPAVVAVMPLLLLPLPLAVVVWTVSGAVGTAAAIRLQTEWRGLLLLPLLFTPLYNAVMMNQATLIWCMLIVLLLLAMRGKTHWLVGLCIVLLPAKPQTGILFALAGLIWIWREQQHRTWWWIAGLGLCIWGTSFLLQPNWIKAWLASVELYSTIVRPPSLLPWGLVLLVVTWRLPWYARLAAAQVVLFPATDLYSSLPLLLTWVGIGGPLALVGSSLSWVWLLAGLPRTLDVLWATILVPLMACAAWRWLVPRAPHLRAGTSPRLADRG